MLKYEFVNEKEIMSGVSIMINICLLSYVGIKILEERYGKHCLDLLLEESKLSELDTQCIPNTTSDTKVYVIIQIIDAKEES